MKIGIVCYPTYGGSGVVATELGLALAKKGNEIHFISYKQPVRLDFMSEKIFFHQVYVPDYPLFKFQPYELALSSKLVDVVMNYNIDLLHVHYAIPHAYAAYMAKKMLEGNSVNLPVVTTLHGTDITLVGNHPFYKNAVKFSIDNSDYVTAVSNSLKVQTENIFNTKKKIEVIPNFVDFSKHKLHNKNCNRDLIASNEKKIISHVSNFRPVKRVLDVVKIFQQVRKKIPSKLIMVGDGPDRIKAESYCAKMGFIDDVNFLGNTEMIYEVLCYSDLFLLPSEAESFGLAALEAMMMEVPVISTNVGGIPEVNKDKETGFLFNIGDIKGMSKKSIEILSNENQLKRLKARARLNAKKFKIEDVVEMYLGAYKKTLKLT